MRTRSRFLAAATACAKSVRIIYLGIRRINTVNGYWKIRTFFFVFILISLFFWFFSTKKKKNTSGSEQWHKKSPTCPLCSTRYSVPLPINYSLRSVIAPLKIAPRYRFFFNKKKPSFLWFCVYNEQAILNVLDWSFDVGRPGPNSTSPNYYGR